MSHFVNVSRIFFYLRFTERNIFTLGKEVDFSLFLFFHIQRSLFFIAGNLYIKSKLKIYKNVYESEMKKMQKGEEYVLINQTFF